MVPLSMIFHFFAVGTGVRTARARTFVSMLDNAFLERDLSIVGGRHQENPSSLSNYLDFKVTTVRVLPKLGFTKELISERPFCHFSRKKS
jgi:hypothetical protein